MARNTTTNSGVNEVLYALLGALVASFICLFLWWWSHSPVAREIEIKSQGYTIVVTCTRQTYRLVSIEDKGDMWEGITDRAGFVRAPKAVCSVLWLEGKPK
jgi:hypothetical protein